MTSVFRKLLQLTSSQKRTVSVGTMTNLVVVDSQVSEILYISSLIILLESNGHYLGK